MNNKNIESYLSTICATLDNLQQDFDFLNETASFPINQQSESNRKLLEEIENLKKQILTLENKNLLSLCDEGVCNKITTRDVNENNAEHIEIIENLKKELETEKQDNLMNKYIIKTLKNEIIDLKGSIRIFLRIREIEGGLNYSITNDTIKFLHDNRDFSFQYDKIFTHSQNQQVIFNELSDIIGSAVEGYKICIFAYGQTGSGKTYTMIGTENFPGILYRTLNLLYTEKSKIEQKKNSSVTFKFSCLEIYNEEIYDMLEQSTATKTTFANRNHRNLTSFQEAFEVISNVLNFRRTAKTECNDQSSRSHLICNIDIITKSENETCNGSLCFIDLAGSERINQSKVEGIHLKETCNINKSLSSLGDVFMAILKNENHVPYRNSKLTHVLQNFFDSKSRVVMILNITNDQKNINETVSTLRFGFKISNCKFGKVVKNTSKNI